MLNGAYNAHGIVFHSAGIDVSANSTWATVRPERADAEWEMKSTLRVGGYSDLNLYFPASMGGKVMGFSKYPAADPNTTTVTLDGVVLRASCLPGGVSSPHCCMYVRSSSPS